MTNALDRAAQMLKPELDRYGIEVPEGQWTVLHGGMATRLQKYTEKKKCLTFLRRLIKQAKEAEFKRTQTGLFT